MEEYEIIEGDSSTTEESTEETQVDVEKVLSTNKKLYARLKEAEADSKRVKDLEAEIEKLKNPVEKVVQQTPTAQTDSVSREEVILFAKGFTLEDVESLKKISAIEGAGLLATAESPIFKAWKEVEDKRKEAETAEIGVSNGSTKTPKKVNFNTPGLTDEQHRALFAKRMGR